MAPRNIIFRNHKREMGAVTIILAEYIEAPQYKNQSLPPGNPIQYYFGSYQAPSLTSPFNGAGGVTSSNSRGLGANVPGGSIWIINGFVYDFGDHKTTPPIILGPAPSNIVGTTIQSAPSNKKQ